MEEDESSCFHVVITFFRRVKRRIVESLRSIFFRRQPMAIEEAALYQGEARPQMFPLVRSHEIGRDSDRMLPPIPPPLPAELTRRRKLSKPVPTYDLATFIQIKDALDRLEENKPEEVKESNHSHEKSGCEEISKELNPSKLTSAKHSSESVEFN